MTLAAKLDLWQKNLLDMSRVNNLLYYRASGRGAGIPFAVAAADLDPLYTRLLAGQPLKVASLPTDVDAEELEARLARLRSRTREDLNDRGIHTLYLTFGLLEWREAPQSDEPIRSPVLLVPVVIERAGVLGQYSLRRLLGEDPEINPTLREKLLHDFRAQLPSFEEIEERFEREQAQRAQANGHGYGRMPAAKLTLDRILREIESALPPQIPGRAVRRELHLGRFFFQKLVMYRDLQRNRANVLAHPLLRVLGGDGEHLPQPADLIPARDLDRRVPPHEMNEILDADSSQQEAIVAAKRGASFVLQGPPGTGKSQTIANMIAEALGQGKRVLFVSEKMAALEVVRKHLDTAGLGEFCLDLHNPRADKKAFILDLKESLHAAQTLTPENALAWQREADALQAAREELNRFVRELHLPRLALGKSAYDAYGRLAALHGVPDSAFALADVASVDHAQLERMRRALADLDAHAEVLDQYDTYPWRETTVRAYSLQLAADIRAHFGRLERELERCEAALTAMRPLLGDDQGLVTGGWAAETLRIADAAVTTPLPPRRWLDVEALPLYKAHAAEAATWSAAYHDRRERLLARYRADILACDSAALLRVLAEETPAALAALRAPGGEAPQDVAMRERDALSAHLPRARDTLDALLPAARTLAELCGLPAPATLADIADLDEIGACLLATPAPPEHWLDPAAFAHVRADVTQAAEAYVTRARMRADLQGRYMPAFFELPLADLAARFRERYASPLRLLMPGYYRDAGALRGLLRQPGPYPFARQREDVEQAARLLEVEARLRGQRGEHAALIGSMFQGEQTDWGAVHAALDWVGTLHRRLAGRPLTEEMRRLAAGSARHLRALRQRYERFHGLWAAWQDEAAYLEETCEVERLLGEDSLLEDADVAATRGALARLYDALEAAWAALDEIAAHRLPPAPGSTADGNEHTWEQIRDDLTWACELHEAEAWMTAHGAALAEELAGAGFAGLDTDWPRVLAPLDWTERFLALFEGRAVPEPLARLVTSEPGEDAEDQRATLRAALAVAHEASAAIDEELRFADTVLPRRALTPDGGNFSAAPLAGIRGRIRHHLDHLPELERWLACAQHLDACRALGLGGALDALLRERPFPRDAVARFEKRFYTLWLDCVWREAPILAQFRGESHERTIARFRELDQRHIELARRRLIARLSERRHAYARNANSPALIELKRQVQLKRHKPIRQIMRRTGGALLEIKPCWMMSPLSISQFLEEGAPLFDLVIFDEASQVCAEDAICAILRGKQLIVVGDSEQLPPTRFFSKSLADDDDEDEAEGADAAEEERERVESILDECKIRMPERPLRWHYRSQHEALIAFSNAHFYRGNLITFPSPDTGDAAGVRWVHVEDGIYERSRSRTNPREAARVVDLIIEHVRHHPKLSLGVVALSSAQQRAIEDALETRRKRDATLAAYDDQLDEDKPGGFFVKNLESVQGDERDVIILSVGYGRDANGKVYTNFGPVNKPGGERRLNVAVTRARAQLILVSSMRADDLPAAPANPGVRTLRDYLTYAEHGPAALREDAVPGAGPDRAPVRFDSDFEEAVFAALAARGLQLDTQVGCSGYRIDLAVRDPWDPRRYVLGIECDGARYHSSATARDRDRLRQRHLERMGWAIHRIWSTDWLRDPEGEIAKVLERLAAATSAHPAMPPRSGNPAHPVATTPEPVAVHAAVPSGAEIVDGDAARAASGDLLAPTVPLNGRSPGPHPAPGLGEPGRILPPLPARAAPATAALPEARDPGSTLARPRPPAAQGATGDAHQPVRDAAETLQRPRDPLLARLRALGLEVVDMRPKGGRLWVVGGYDELMPRMRELEQAGYRFAFMSSGSSATRNRPGWYAVRDVPA